MSIGFNFHTILDRLEEFHPCRSPALSADREFSEVNLLPRPGEHFRPSCIYICQWEEAQPLARTHPDICFVCVNNGTPCKTPLPNTLILNTGASLAVILNQVHELFIVLRHWVDNMRLTVSTTNELQPLLTLAENIMYNPIAVLDPSWKLLASTKGIQTDDPVFQKLLARGYHTPEELLTLRQSKYASLVYAQETTLVKPPEDISNYTELIRVIRIGGNFAACVTMLCSNRPYTPGLRVLFELLVEQLTASLEQYQGSLLQRAPFEYVLADLLDGQIQSEAVLAERARSAGLAVKQGYFLLCPACPDENALPASVLHRLFSEQLPDARAFLYRDGVLLLLSCPEPALCARTALADVLSSFSATLQEQQMYCGVSGWFSHLLDLPVAYAQASAAVQTGPETTALPEVFPPREDRLFFYEEEMLPHMAKLSSQAIPCEHMASPLLLSLLEGDRKRGTDDAKLLYVYLSQDRNTTRTAAKLGMHRNNVIYRVNRLEQRLGISLDDPDLRLRLLVSYHILSLR